MSCTYLSVIVRFNVVTKKYVEVAPCVSMNDEQREEICQAAVRLMKHVGYVNAGTVEFLVEGDRFLLY